MTMEVKTKEFLMNMGPQHPSTHGVLRLLLHLEGEVVKDCEVVVGYLHRGIEKLGEVMTYPQWNPYTDRLDYTAAFSNNVVHHMAVEKLAGIEVPRRAEFIRVIFAEFSRISGHLLWLATHALDIGAMTVFLWCFRERERVLDLFEMMSGARLTIHGTRIGGLPDDIPPQFWEKAIEFTETFPGYIEDYEALLTKNRIWLKRTRDVAVISGEDAVDLGLTGPSLRGSGVDWDIRKAEPYLVYDEMDFIVPLGERGDVYDRYVVRLEEMRQANNIIKQCMEKIPDGPILAKVPRVLKPPKGEVYVRIEAPKGELGIYLVSDGTDKPHRCRIRSPSFVNLESLPPMVRGGLLADAVAAIGSIDIVLGEVDR
jgi:NADH-quinone oxidoreductase subunit D